MKLGLVSSPVFLRHDTGGHVEGARRLEAVVAELNRSGVAWRCVPVHHRPATDAELRRVHTAEHVERIEQAAREAAEDGEAWLDSDTVVSAESARVAREAVGGLLELVGRTLEGHLDRGLALVRPPGHHATPDRAMGFCLYSNAALAARFALAAGCRRVAVFDPDVHHGNGTQEALWGDPSALLVSVHQHPLYPGTGMLDERDPAGTTVNLPLPAGQGDAEYLWAFDRLVAPVLERFDPELLLVSAGYDAHREDPLGGMNLSTEGFRQLALRIARLSRRCAARGRVVAALEGGYHPPALAASVRATLEAWLDEGEPEPVSPDRVRRDCRDLVERAREGAGLSTGP